MNEDFEVGIDTIDMYRSVIPPEFLEYRRQTQEQRALLQFSQSQLMRIYYGLESVQKGHNPLYHVNPGGNNTLMWKEYIKDMGWKNLHLHYDVMNIKTGYIRGKNGNEFPRMRFWLKVRHEENDNWIIVSPEIQIGALPKIHVSMSLYSFYFKDHANLNKSISWIDALLEFRDFFHDFWDDARKDFGADPWDFRDNQKWYISRFDLDYDLSTGSDINSFYLLQNMSNTPISEYHLTTYTSGQSIRLKPKMRISKSSITGESTFLKSRLPYLDIYNKKTALIDIHKQTIEPTIRAEKMYYKSTFRNDTIGRLKKYFMWVINNEYEYLNYDFELSREYIRDRIKEVYDYRDCIVPFLQKYSKGAQNLKVKYPDIDVDLLKLLELVHRNNGTGSIRYYCEEMEYSKKKVQNRLERLRRLKVIDKPYRKWCITRKGIDILGGRYSR